MKFKQGYIINMDGVQKDVIVNAPLPNKVKNALIGTAIIGVGIYYIAATAFKYGSLCFSDAEYKTMVNLGIIKD